MPRKYWGESFHTEYVGPGVETAVIVDEGEETLALMISGIDHDGDTYDVGKQYTMSPQQSIAVGKQLIEGGEAMLQGDPQ